VNVALYGPPRPRWAFTEYPAKHVQAARDTLSIGNSAASWDGSTLKITVDERSAPVPDRVVGTIRVHPETLTNCCMDLDADGLHRWQPIAPRVRVEMEFTQPRVHWVGNGYLDSNRGAEPLEDGFSNWTWLRADTRDGSVVLYDVMPRTGDGKRLGLSFDHSGNVQQLAVAARSSLPHTFWRIPRSAHSEDSLPRVLATLEDAPFYARSLVAARLRGENITAVHESLSLDRFRTRWVRTLLPFRMRRVGA
jgi:carotenoid 1,2-hydratase